MVGFWTYMAYINTGQVGEAEAVLDSLSVFDQYPYGNITLLATASSLYQYWDSPEMSDLLEQANMFLSKDVKTIATCLTALRKCS